MEVYTEIKKNTYQDSMKLMQLQAAIDKIPGIVRSGIAMATPINQAQFKEAGLLTQEIEQAHSNDLCIAIKAESAGALSSALDKIKEYFS